MRSDGPVPRVLTPEGAESFGEDKIEMDETKFRWMLNEDAMATEKLAEAIRISSHEYAKMEAMIKDMFKFPEPTSTSGDE